MWHDMASLTWKSRLYFNNLKTDVNFFLNVNENNCPTTYFFFVMTDVTKFEKDFPK